MRLCDRVALVAVLIISIVGAFFTITQPSRLYFGDMPTGKWLIAVAGWVTATYGPVVLGLSLWRLAKLCPVPWAIHVLLMPGLYALLVGGNRLILSTLYVKDYDATLGAPVMPAFASLLATIIIYYSAVVTEPDATTESQSRIH
jgi:hypothetical protein